MIGRRLTRYVLGAYLRPLAAGAGALIVLVMMADLMERLDKFITGKSGLWPAAQYVLLLVPLRLTEIMPVAALLAAILCLGSLSHHKELTAAMSGGVHPWRCVRPLLWTGLALSLFCLALGEYVNPAAAQRAREIWNEDVRHVDTGKATRFENVTAIGRDGELYAVRLLDLESGVMEGVVVDRSVGGRPRAQFAARRAEWMGGRWTLMDGVVRTFGEDGVELVRQTPFVMRELKTRETPHDLAPVAEETDTLGYRPLKERIRRLKAVGVPTRRLEVDLHMKLALPWANLIVLLLGIPFAFQASDGKVKAVAFALGTAFFYFGLMQVGRAVGQKPWCAPWLGAWMTNIIFLTIGSAMFLRMRRLV